MSPRKRPRSSFGRIPVQRGFVLTPDDHVRRFVIHQLMCNFGVDKRETEKKRDWQREKGRLMREKG